MRRFLAAAFLALAAPAFSLPQGESGEQPDREEDRSAGERPLTGPGLYENAQDGQLVELRGRVRLVGNEPFPELVLSEEDGHDWFILPEDRPLLAAYEQQTVTIRGRVKLQEMILANGQKLDPRRFLIPLKRNGKLIIEN